MTEQRQIDIETLLREAMAPIEPPERLGVRVEATLRTLTELAADELESWELVAMRDPRNWIRPVVAVAVGSAAGTGLAVLGWRQRSKARSRTAGASIDRAAEGVAAALRRQADRLR
ncbi:hypothetical protein [Patulibacter sp. SYSU D01012]|uniref:hypothetical protein n=1 Tax=Patulibacter sp. SYSU D01012 TaxID=2817381 RepID=UPI001B301903|nr:hypothetical protein [Patulibacter sp. SYSU D01012]